MPATGDVDTQTDEHAKPGGRESVVPPIELAERAADQWRDEGADIDREVIDRNAAVAARVGLCIQFADLRRQISLSSPEPTISANSANRKAASKAIRK